MTKLDPTTSPLALAAILAASAIPFTAASAQEAAAPAPAPVIVLPPVDAVPAAPAPAPVIVLPDVTTPPAAAQSAPEPAASPNARTEPRAATRTTTRSSNRTTEPSSPSAVAGPAASEPSTIVPPVTIPDAATAPIGAPVTADPAPVAEAPVAPAEDNGWLIPLALGGMALGGGIAYAATAGKRRRKIQPADAAVYRGTRNEARAPLATSSFAATIAGADARRQANPEVVPAGTPTYAADGPAGATPAAARQFNEPARIPAGPVPTGAERQALIERMVAAAPDASNPFHSRKSRRKRARIMLASAEHRQRTAATEPFDFRNYAPFSQQEAGRTVGQQTSRIKESVN
ncbi:hypothetical protein [Novosphingobium aquae]|uniref:Uncharacterized protein n=1 Tax=Novosphingobium aquae TaxID=3133435 RepID=A0ABU8SBF3_9SPHN